MSFSAPSGIFFTLDSLGLPTSQAQFLQLWLQVMQAQYGNDFSPSQGDLEYVQAQVFASWAASVAQLCTSGATELFSQYGQKLYNLPPLSGTPAQAIITVNAKDTAGYTLPGLTQITLGLNGTAVGFQTATQLVIPPGSSSGQVTVIAVQSGSSFNGAGAPASIVSQVSWVTSAAAVTQASGGADQEDSDRYVQRLAATLQLQAPRVITASDYATMALNFVPAADTDQEEVGRATAIDGYDPLVSEGGYQPNGSGTGTFNNEREVTVCITDASGLALNSDTMTAVGGFLANLREVNFIVNVIPPTYTTIYVAVTVKGLPGFSASAVQANVQTALLNYLNPTNFGLPQGAIVGWNNSTSVYLSKVSAVIQGTLGVQDIPAGGLAVGTAASPTNTTHDLTLSGAFPLVTSTTVSVPLAAITVI